MKIYKLRICGPNRSKPFYISADEYNLAVFEAQSFMLKLFDQSLERFTVKDPRTWGNTIRSISYKIGRFKQVGICSLFEDEYILGATKAIKPTKKAEFMKRFHVKKEKLLFAEMRSSRHRQRILEGHLYVKNPHSEDLCDKGFIAPCWIKRTETFYSDERTGVHCINQDDLVEEILTNIYGPVLHNSLLDQSVFEKIGRVAGHKLGFETISIGHLEDNPYNDEIAQEVSEGEFLTALYWSLRCEDPSTVDIYRSNPGEDEITFLEEYTPDDLIMKISKFEDEIFTKVGEEYASKNTYYLAYHHHYPEKDPVKDLVGRFFRGRLTDDEKEQLGDRISSLAELTGRIANYVGGYSS